MTAHNIDADTTSFIRSSRGIQAIRIILAGTILLIVQLWWPGDVPFINDEAKLLANALAANSQGRLASRGLMGTAGVFYGPIPTWFYQFCLTTTSNPVFIGCIKTIVSWALLLAALGRIARLLQYPPSTVLLVMVSPYFYFYQRHLWDNTFLMPLSALLFLLYLEFAVRPRLWLVYGQWLVVVAMAHVHLMSGLLAIAYLAVFLWFERSWLKAHWRSLCFGVLVGAIISAPYARVAIASVEFSDRLRVPAWRALQGGFDGWRFFSFWGWGDYLVPEIYGETFGLSPLATDILILITACSLIYMVAGLVDAGRELVRRSRQWNRATPEDKISVLCIATIIVTVCGFAWMRRMPLPHYFAGVWLPYWFLMARGVKVLGSSRRFAPGYAIYWAAMIGLLVNVICFIHQHGGNRRMTYGATLGNQMAVVRRISEYSPSSPVVVAVDNYRLFPDTLYTLIDLLSDRSRAHNRPAKRIVIVYDETKGTTSGWITAHIDE